jgi:hypothetical protein
MNPVDVDLSDALTGKPIFFTYSSTSKEEGGVLEAMGEHLNLQDLQKFKKAVQVLFLQSPNLETFQDPRNRSKESVPPAYVAWRAGRPGTSNRVLDSWAP